MLYGRKWPIYQAQWDSMVVLPKRRDEFTGYAKQAIRDSDRYMEIANATGVPWPMIAVIHRRESDSDFTTYLGNGDKLSKKTVNVPRGRGPFPSFFAGALDALHVDRLDEVARFGHPDDWRLEKMLYYLELFNGPGYAARNKPSTYLWGGTSIQEIGRFRADNKWAGNVWDKQPGCAPILKIMSELQPSIMFVRED